jgi:hypothetical protein
MKKPLWITIAATSAVVLFGSGLLVGRHFPAHHFEKISQDPYLLDTSTGRVCDYLGQDQGLTQPSTASGSQSNDPEVSAALKALNKQTVSIPPCN